MLLSAKFLVDVGGVNSFKEVSTIQMTEGDTVDVYLQLRDMSVNLATEGFNPPGRRFVPAAGATLQVILNTLDNAKKIVKIATQPYSTLDGSIWRFSISASDAISGTVTCKLQLSEGSKVTRGIIQPAILVSDLTGLSK